MFKITLGAIMHKHTNEADIYPPYPQVVHHRTKKGNSNKSTEEKEGKLHFCNEYNGQI